MSANYGGYAPPDDPAPVGGGASRVLLRLLDSPTVRARVRQNPQMLREIAQYQLDAGHLPTVLLPDDAPAVSPARQLLGGATDQADPSALSVDYVGATPDEGRMLRLQREKADPRSGVGYLPPEAEADLQRLKGQLMGEGDGGLTGLRATLMRTPAGNPQSPLPTVSQRSEAQQLRDLIDQQEDQRRWRGRRTGEGAAIALGLGALAGGARGAAAATTGWLQGSGQAEGHAQERDMDRFNAMLKQTQLNRQARLDADNRAERDRTLRLREGNQELDRLKLQQAGAHQQTQDQAAAREHFLKGLEGLDERGLAAYLDASEQSGLLHAAGIDPAKVRAVIHPQTKLPKPAEPIDPLKVMDAYLKVPKEHQGAFRAMLAEGGDQMWGQGAELVANLPDMAVPEKPAKFGDTQDGRDWEQLTHERDQLWRVLTAPFGQASRDQRIWASKSLESNLAQLQAIAARNGGQGQLHLPVGGKAQFQSPEMTQYQRGMVEQGAQRVQQGAEGLAQGATRIALSLQDKTDKAVEHQRQKEEASRQYTIQSNRLQEARRTQAAAEASEVELGMRLQALRKRGKRADPKELQGAIESYKSALRTSDEAKATTERIAREVNRLLKLR